MTRSVDGAAGPAVYTPYSSGVYRVAGGLSPLGRSFGNGDADGRVFQVDSDFERYRENTVRARVEDLSKYYAVDGFAADTESAVASFIVRRLVAEHPAYFSLSEIGGRVTLECGLTGDILCFDDGFRLEGSSGPDYAGALDALASQVQEDLSVMQVGGEGGRLVAAHVTAASGWDPRVKAGMDFSEIHAPVPGIADVVRTASAVMRGILEGEPRQRFVWGVSTNDDLDHHPDRLGSQPSEFDASDPRLFVRMERQVLVGIESVSAMLFCVHVYHRDCRKMDPEERVAVRLGIVSMSDASREYKGVAASFDAMVAWLGSF